MKILIWFGLAILSATSAFSQSEDIVNVGTRVAAAEESRGSEFYIEKNLVDKVYSQTITAEAQHHSTEGTMIPQIGVLAPTQFQLQNDYFAVDYAEELGSLPFISLALVKRFYSIGRMDFSAKGEAGFSYKQGTFKASSDSGPSVEDTITLQWVPVTAAMSAEYRPPWASWIRPAVELIAGAHWLHHTGTIDGLDHSEWVPVYGGGTSLILFPKASSSDGFFGGISVGAAYQQSTNSDQRIKGWQYKLGSTIVL